MSIHARAHAVSRHITKQEKQMTEYCSICKDEKACTGYFGFCPVCHKNDGYANAGRSHRFYCKEHKTSWFVGSNLFSSWRGQTEAEQRAIWDGIGLNEFEDVEPYHPPDCIAFVAADKAQRELDQLGEDEAPF